MDKKKIRTISNGKFAFMQKNDITEEQLFGDYAYVVSQKQAEILYKAGLLDEQEYEKLSELNLIKFKPFMADILADIT